MLKLLVEVIQGLCIAGVLVGAALTFPAGVTFMVVGAIIFTLLEVRG